MVYKPAVGCCMASLKPGYGQSKAWIKAVLLARAHMVGVWTIKLGRLVLGKTLCSADMSTQFGHELWDAVILPDSEGLCLLDERRALGRCCASSFLDKQHTDLQIQRFNSAAAESQEQRARVKDAST